MRRPRRADRAAEYLGRPDAGEEQSIEAGVPRLDRSIANIRVHALSMTEFPDSHQRFSDMLMRSVRRLRSG
jgi:hypothetical protein